MTAKKNVGRPPADFTDTQLANMLHKCKGKIHTAAKRLGVCSNTIYTRIRGNPVLKQIRKEYHGLLADLAETNLEALVKMKYFPAVAFTLKTLAKDRGFVERKEFRHGGDASAPPIQSTNTNLTINPDELSLDVRKALLEHIRQKKLAMLQQNTLPQIGFKEIIDSPPVQQEPTNGQESDK